MILRLITFCTLWMVILSGFSQIRAQVYNSISYGTELGLPAATFHASTQDSLGNMWFASSEGVTFYNGSSLITTRDNLPSPIVSDIIARDDGSVLALTPDGLAVLIYDGESIRIKQYLNGQSESDQHSLQNPSRIFKDEFGSIWITENNAVVRLHDSLNEFDRFLVSGDAPDKNPPQIFTHTGDVYAILKTGDLYWFDHHSSEFIRLSLSVNTTSAGISDIISADRFLYSGGPDGFYRVDAETGNSVRIGSVTSVHTLIYDKPRGRIIIGTRNNGVYSYSVATERLQQHPLSNWSIRNLNHLFIDPFGAIWASGDQGITIFYKTVFNSMLLDRKYNHIQSMKRLGDELYVSNQNGIYRIIKNNNQQYEPVLVHEPEDIFTAFTKRNGHIVTTDNSGNIHIHLEDSTVSIPVSSYAHTNPFLIQDLYIDHNNYIWVISDEHPGVFRINKQNEVEWLSKNDGLNGSVNGVYELDNQKLMVTTSSKDSYLYVHQEYNDRFTPLPALRSDHISELRINDVEKTNSGAYVLATDSGLFKITDDIVVEIHNRHGESIPSTSIHIDHLQNLWVGTEYGLYIIRNNSAELYGTVDGLPSERITRLSIDQDAYCTMWIGTHRGLGYLEDNSQIYIQTPQPVITQVRSDGISYPIVPHTQLPFSDQLEFLYSTSIYPVEHVTYNAQIIGSNGDVLYEQNSPVKTLFSNIPPGSYTLRVTAQRTGTSVSLPQELAFEISPPWYLSRAANLLYLFGTIMLFAFMFKYRSSIIQRNKVQADLESTSNQLGIILENIPIILFSINNRGVFETAVGRGLELIGLSKDSVVGKHINEVYSEPEILDAMDKALDGNEVRYNRTIGENVLESKLSPLFNPDGTVKKIIGVAIEVTERKKVEQKLIETKNAAEAANKAKSAFMANMSHELRTPLNAVLGFAQVLLKRDSVSRTDKSYVDTIYQSGNHLLNMINDILDISKIEAGKSDLDIQRFNLHGLLEDLQSMLGYRATEKQLEFKLHIAPDLPVYVKADQHKLRQILINLVGNAIKYTETGSVSLSVEIIPETMSKSDPQLFFYVTDTGRGIPENELDSVFKPFHQVKSDTDQGTGLGLTISKRLAEIMDGDLTMESTYGKGSTFYLMIPFENTSQSKSDKNNQLRIDINGIKNRDLVDVLVVDDVEANRSLITTMMDFIPEVRVFAVSNGEDAVSFCAQKMPDLVIMDIVMPVMDGKQALEIIRKLPDGDKVSIIAISAGGLQGTRKELLELGFDEFIRKPVYEEQLLQAMKEQLDLVWRYKYSNNLNSDIDPTLELHDLIRKESPQWQRKFEDALMITDFNMLNDLISDLPDNSILKKQLFDIIQDNNFRTLLSLSEKFD